MQTIVLIAALGVVVALFGAVAFFVIRGRSRAASEKVKEGGISTATAPAREEEEEHDFPGLGVSFEETEEGCPEKIKRRLLQEQERLFREAHKIYLVITQMFKSRNLPPEVKKELEIFLRSYGRLHEMKEEIEVYPFSDCDQVFQLKFSFYNKLIKETAQKLIVFARSLR